MGYLSSTSSKGTISTERALCLLEDLHLLQTRIQKEIIPLISDLIFSKLQTAGNVEYSEEEIRATFVEPLFSELDLRFDIIAKPCISAICKKVETRLAENVGGFK